METSVDTKGKFGVVLSQEEWNKIVKNKLNTSNFKILETSVKPFSEMLVGFFGEHLTLEAKVGLYNENQNSISENLNLEFFAKCVPKEIPEFEYFVRTTKGFVKEYRFYSDIIPDLMKYQSEERSPWACNCYLAKSEILVMENLMNQGFRHFDCKPSIDYKHCVLLTETLARFHAQSVIFEEKESCSIQDKHSDILFETIWVATQGHPGNDSLHCSAKAALNLLEHQPDFKTNQEKYKIVKEKYSDVAMEICEYVKPSKKYRNVICHGDVWSSNVFFRYNEKGEPTEARLVDFQLFRYNPPAHDFISFLFFTSDKKFRQMYMDEMMAIYYKCFSEELLRYGLIADELQFSWEEFKESCEFYRRGATIISVLYYQNIAMSADYLKKVYSDPKDIIMYIKEDKSKYVTENYLTDSYYRQRNHEALQEMIEYCILRDPGIF